MERLPFTYLILCLWLAAPLENAAEEGFYPTNIVNTAAFWNYRDLPTGPIAAWTNEMPSHEVLANWPGAGGGKGYGVTNTGLGMYFCGAGMLNTTKFKTDNDFSLWVDIAMVRGPFFASQIYGSRTPSTENLVFSQYDVTGCGPGVNPLNGYWEGNNVWSGHNFGCVLIAGACVTNPPLWNDIVDSQGRIFLNGAPTAGDIGRPHGSISWEALGNNSAASHAQSLNGYIKYLLLCTNHAITAAEATNLWIWEQTNGVTNVSGGCIGWWKFNDASKAATLADASGHGHDGTLYNSDLGNLSGSGRNLPIWTNGLNAVVNQALTFNGSNTVYIPFTGVLNSTFITISIWTRFTDVTAAGSWVAAYGPTWSTKGGVGAYIFSDGFYSKPGNIRGGLLDPTHSGEETGTLVMSDNNWHHFVFASDSTNFYSWFDGVRSLGTQTGVGRTIKGPVNNFWYTGITNLAFSFGTVYETNQPCTMTDIRIWNRVLNDSEVDILYRAPTADWITGTYRY